jgi:dihydrofolate reductase
MRNLIVTNIVSLDGFYEGPGKNVMVLPMDHRFDAYNTERIKAASTLVLGRTSYELFSSFWPAMADSPDASDAHREFARLENAIDKVVVSDTLTPDDLGPWRETTRIIRRADARSAIADLKDGPGADILMFGSHILWNDLLEEGLVDELHLIVGSVVLRDGTKLFETATAPALELVDIRRWDDSNNVLMRYAVVPPIGA